MEHKRYLCVTYYLQSQMQPSGHQSKLSITNVCWWIYSTFQHRSCLWSKSSNKKGGCSQFIQCSSFTRLSVGWYFFSENLRSFKDVWANIDQMVESDQTVRPSTIYIDAFVVQCSICWQFVGGNVCRSNIWNHYIVCKSRNRLRSPSAVSTSSSLAICAPISEITWPQATSSSDTRYA